MIVLKVPLKDAEKVKKHLIEKDLFEQNYKITKEGDFLLFPLKKEVKIKGTQIIDKELEKFVKTQNAKSKIFDQLTEEEQKILKTAFDIIGDIAIIEIDKELAHKEKIIAQAILDSHKNINTVLKKSGIHGGTFRIQHVKYLAGENKTITIHKENNCRLKLDVDKSYFSPRLCTERKRIMQQVKPGEDILCMFSGVAPYPIVISKNTLANKILAIEINPNAHKFALENLKLNKIKNVALINGDVNEIVPKLNKTYDRIIMPLPKSAEEFLDSALKVARSGTIIHFYDFLHKTKFHEAHEKIDLACKKNNLNYSILNTVRCGQHAPYTFRICVDFKIK